MKPRAVIVGGGFAGLYLARELGGAGLDVILVDRTNHHVFQPMLYQVATAGLSPGDIAAPIRWVLRHQDNVRVLLADVQGIDLAGRVRLQNHMLALCRHDEYRAGNQCQHFAGYAAKQPPAERGRRSHS